MHDYQNAATAAAAAWKDENARQEKWGGGEDEDEEGGGPWMNNYFFLHPLTPFYPHSIILWIAISANISLETLLCFLMSFIHMCT